MIRCNDQNTTAQATACTQSSVQNSNVLFGTGESVYQNVIEGPGFLAAGIPWVSYFPIGLSDYNGTAATVGATGGTAAGYSAMATYAVKVLHLKKVALIKLDLPQLDFVDGVLTSAVKAAGGQMVADVPISPSTVDLTSAIQQASAAGAQVIFPADLDSQSVDLLQHASGVGYNGAFALTGVTLQTAAVSQAANAQSAPVISNRDFGNPQAKTSAMTQYRNAMKAAGYGSASNINSAWAPSVGYFTGMYIQQAISAIGPSNVARSALAKYLQTQGLQRVTGFTGPVGAAIRCPIPGAPAPLLCQHAGCGDLKSWKDREVRASDEPDSRPEAATCFGYAAIYLKLRTHRSYTLGRTPGALRRISEGTVFCLLAK